MTRHDANRPQCWFITGVGSGLGRALAEAVLARGDTVWGTSREASTAESFTASVPGRSRGLRLDLRNEEDVRAAVAAAEAHGPGIDILVNNAGYGLVGGVEEASLEEIRAQFDVNVFGPVALMQAVLPFMRNRRAGRIVNISSVSGLVGWPSLGLYSGSKFALEGISETLALELEPLGIKVILIEPGGMRSNFATGNRQWTARRFDDYDATVGESRRILMNSIGQELGDVVKAAAAVITVACLASPPPRLLLGSDAIEYTLKKIAVQRAQIDAFETLSRSTDHQDGNVG
jgi:NAD(P)-dependent dehydrogenase (short-subunit alcohol dehydrogenase family)